MGWVEVIGGAVIFCLGYFLAARNFPEHVRAFKRFLEKLDREQ